jgi:U32 family peptidase
MRPELLMPAGDLEKMRFAFQYGADAVYAGVPMLSLRARENRFSIDTVREGVGYAKKLGKKIYLTVNIAPHNYKIPALVKALKPMAELKPDALIVSDPGVVMLCRETIPEVPLHLSVQANTVNWASAQYWHKQGIERIILSRELPLEEVREIHEKNPGLELEYFVHGSICMAYSGRCLLSNYLTYRDANQGTCAHVCRWKYKAYLEDQANPGKFMELDDDEHGSYIMNSKDMCLIEYLKQLKDAGVCSFKVEGRNKTVFYVATVARAYRQAIDEMAAGKPFNPAHIKELAKASNRGFFPGFLMGNPQEKAQEYEKNHNYQTSEFIGVVRAVHDAKTAGNRLYEIEVKGRFDTPDKCEIMTPDADYIQKIDTFFTPDRKEIATIHPGQKDHAFFESSHDLPVGTILRKELSQNPPVDATK